MCAHGSPLHEDHYIVSMRDAWAPLQRMATEITFFGHTHVQGSFSQQAIDWEEQRPAYAVREGLVEQTMSVPKGVAAPDQSGGAWGRPRDHDWRAAFALYDEGAESVTFYRVPYDVEAAQRAIRKAGLPERLAARLSGGTVKKGVEDRV